MSSREAGQTEISKGVFLDGRLALFHKRQRWLAVADLHFGFELSQRAAGNLFPLWGMQTIETRLNALIRDYKPRHLILLGDLVHDRMAAPVFSRLLRQLRESADIILISGNHDRELDADFELLSSWRNNGFCFHHGHCEMSAAGEIQVIGHHHPAHVVRDGAGLRLKLPVLVQQENCWIMPAFSPWAAGTEWQGGDDVQMWLCSPQRVFQLGPLDDLEGRARLVPNIG
jgi:DNA ligase-associated metallophosphoesterase